MAEGIQRCRCRRVPRKRSPIAEKQAFRPGPVLSNAQGSWPQAGPPRNGSRLATANYVANDNHTLKQTVTQIGMHCIATKKLPPPHIVKNNKSIYDCGKFEILGLYCCDTNKLVYMRRSQLHPYVPPVCAGPKRINNVIMDAKKGGPKCRIPQRLIGPRQPTNSNSLPRGRGNFVETAVRPKSANRMKEELNQNKVKHALPKFTKLNERTPPSPGQKPKQSALPKKLNFAESVKSTRPVIMVPISHLDQESLRGEITEEQSQSPTGLDQRSDRVSLASRGDLVELKIIWQDKMVQFENMKGDLKELQKNILALYAKMRETHQKMSFLGETAHLPPAEDLRIMNVSNLTPEQLLQLCAGDDARSQWDATKKSLTIDLNKFYDMPTKLVNTCEQTLAKRKEIIDWFETLKSQEKGISVHKLSKKINEFNAENDMLKCSLETSKNEFLKELEDIISFLRKSVNDTVATQRRMEELSLEMSQLREQNIDLSKQLHSTDHLRTQVNKSRVEELEKELKEEKCKRLFMRDRLSRSEGQVKLYVERATQLEATLEQARSQIWSLERTVQQLHEQNKKLQNDFDTELSKLTESIKEHTEHLEEIADAREKLQAEKEDLEKRLTELSAYYNESLQNMKLEMAANVGKVIDSEKKYEALSDDKKKLEQQLEVLCNQLLEAELRHKAIVQEMREKESLLNKETDAIKELEITKRKLEEANSAISEIENKLTKQNEILSDTERRLKDAEENIETYKKEISYKSEYINEMESKQHELEQQLRNNENKMEAYVEQLTSLKSHIHQLQEDFGEFENLNDLHEMLKKQRAKLLEATRQNGELAEALQKKDKELEQYNETISEHEHLLLEREGVIKMLSEKEEEQSNIIKILRNNLEMRAQADNHLNQQVMEKNTEIDSLLVNLDTRKQQISNMEKIILTLEDQTRTASLQRQKDQDLIMMLQKKITEYETMQIDVARHADNPENFDSLMKILEEELETSLDNDMFGKGHGVTQNVPKKKSHGDRKRDKVEIHESDTHLRCSPESDALPTKNALMNTVKKICNHISDGQNIGDNLDRKKAITNIDTQRWVSTQQEKKPYAQPQPTLKEPVRRTEPCPPPIVFTRNLQHLTPDQRGDRKLKMFKFAGHRM